jgi:hypothetical protein
VGSGTDTCSVTLSSPASSSGLSVSLATSNAAVSVPAMVIVPANATSAGFTATVSSVGSPQTVALTASAGGISDSFVLQLNVATPILSISTTTLTFGNVAINTAATQSVTLTSTGTAAVTINGAAIAGAGFTVSGATLPVTLNPNQTVTLIVQFDPTVTGSASGQLTITSTSSTNPTSVIGLSGTSGAHEVDLTWNAPSSSADPLAGYNVYRSPSGIPTDQRLNSLVNAATAYADTAVQSGLAYDYFVTSVDASGVESAPSNMTSVTIP